MPVVIRDGKTVADSGGRQASRLELVAFRVTWYAFGTGSVCLLGIWIWRAWQAGWVALLLAFATFPLAFFYPLYAWVKGTAFLAMLVAFFVFWGSYVVQSLVGYRWYRDWVLVLLFPWVARGWHPSEEED